MGAILAILGEAADPELSARLDRMIARSPYRGVAQRHFEPGAAIAIQSLGPDASLAISGNWVVAFHGYIGNWDEPPLAQDGGRPQAGCNAERIARAYEVWGDDLFNLLRGEFAILIYDRRERELVAVRDIAGCRPLFFVTRGDVVFLASEMRQLLVGSDISRDLDDSVLVAYLLEEVCLPEQTPFRGISRIFPQWTYRFRRGGNHSVTTRWEPPQEDRALDDPHVAVGEVRSALLTAVRRAMPGRPFGVTLSGGCDSSAMWAACCRLLKSEMSLAKSCRAYSLVFPGLACDESSTIRGVLAATGGEGSEIDASGLYPTEALEAIIPTLDGLPYPTAYFWDLICAATSRDDRSVLLTGNGGDAWFTVGMDVVDDLLWSGQPLAFLRALGKWQGLPRWRRVRHLISVLLRPFRQSVKGPSPAPAWLAASWRRRPEIPATSLGTGRKRSRAANHRRAWCLLALGLQQTHSSVEGYDQAAARYGVELRHPFFDLDLVNLGFRLPGQALTAFGPGKALLRKSIEGLLPVDVISRLKKASFDVILARESRRVSGSWEFPRWRLASRGLLDPKGLDSLLTTNYTDSEHVRLYWRYVLERFVEWRQGSEG